MNQCEPGEILQIIKGNEITPELMKDAAQLFSNHYGIWGFKGPKPGARIRMNPTILRAQSMPAGKEDSCSYVRAMVDGRLAGHAFCCYWDYNAQKICWITQLVVHSDYRGRKLSIRMLKALRDDTLWGYGILSSHPYACMATVRSFADSIDHINLDVIKEHVASILAASPVPYIHDAEPHGSLFELNVGDGSVSSAFTNFHVDLTEPSEALKNVQARGIEWPFGELVEGHEYMVIIETESGTILGCKNIVSP